MGLGVIVHTFNPSTPEVEASESMLVQTQPVLHSELQDSQSYIWRLCLNK